VRRNGRLQQLDQRTQARPRSLDLPAQGGWARCGSSAARVKFRSRATATKYSELSEFQTITSRVVVPTN